VKRPLRNLLALGGLAGGAWGLSQLVRIARLDAARDALAGQVIVITGASRGFGRAMAHEFAVRGARIALAARSVDQLKAVAGECERIRPGVETLVVPADVTVEADRQNLIDEVIRQFGRVDVLVNNAGIIQGGALHEMGRDFVRDTLEVNLMAMMRLTQIALPAMVTRGSGQIVIMSSASGRHAMPFFIPYSTSKYGLMGFSEGLRRELEGTGVRVLLVTPGYAETDVVASMKPVYERMGFRMIPPERVARMTVEGILLGRAEVKIGFVEAAGGIINQIAPGLADLYWRFVVPRRAFREAARAQRTE
jgi:short-subunit dehydrogenase